MLYVICGLMGAGKTTWARQHYRHVVEFENYGSKKKQIERAQRLLSQGKTVAYITCFPTVQEMEFFESIEPGALKWVLIDTDPVQCRKNIIKRGRKSDTDVIKTRFETNKELQNKILKAAIDFEKIKLFGTDEKW